MSGFHNGRFLVDPLGYLRKHVINNLNARSAVWGTYKNPGDRQLKFAQHALQYVDANCKTIRFDLEPVMTSRGENIILRPVVKDVVSKLPMDVRSYQEGMFFKKEIVLAALLPKDPVPDVLLCGYYFPYKTGVVDDIDAMGWVDIPKHNPQYNFAFTGAMNGCHLVVTQSPADKDLLRVYHYQSPGKPTGANGKFLPKYRGIRTRTYSFPGQVYDWLSDDEYAGQDDSQVNAFNFLYYDTRTDDQPGWWIYSQPTGIHINSQDPKSAEWIVYRGSRKPFRRKLNY